MKKLLQGLLLTLIAYSKFCDANIVNVSFDGFVSSYSSGRVASSFGSLIPIGTSFSGSIVFDSSLIGVQTSPSGSSQEVNAYIPITSMEVKLAGMSYTLDTGCIEVINNPTGSGGTDGVILHSWCGFSNASMPINGFTGPSIDGRYLRIFDIAFRDEKSSILDSALLVGAINSLGQWSGTGKSIRGSFGFFPEPQNTSMSPVSFYGPISTVIVSETTVPEPSTILLMLVAGLGIVGVMSRRKLPN